MPINQSRPPSPVFRVTGPDGAVYQVTAPPGATEAQAIAYARRQAGGQPRPKQAYKSQGVVNTALDFIDNVGDNILPNWGDELAGVGAGLKDAVTGGSFSTGFKRGQAKFQERQKSYKQEHPRLNVLSAGTGMVAGMAAPVGRLAQGASLGRKALHGAAVGAGYGALSGSGEGRTLGERGKNALRSGAAGAGLGAVASPLVSGAAAMGRVARNLPGVEAATRRVGNVPRAVLRKAGLGQGPVRPGQRAQEHADRLMARKMTEGHIQTAPGQAGAPASPTTILQEQQRRQALGVPAMPADATEAMRNLTVSAARGQGPGQSAVRGALDSRRAQEATRVRQHVVEQLGPVGDPLRLLREHQTASRSRAAPLYEEAYSQPMTLTPEIQEIMETPAFQEALPAAIRNIRNARRDPQALGFKMNPDGSVAQQQYLSTEGFDQVVRAMRDAGQAAAERNPITGRLINNTNSIHINERAGDLRDQLAAQNDAYRSATGQYADDMAQRDAFLDGQDIGKLSGHEINSQGFEMADNARDAWSLGARISLADEAPAFAASHPNGDTAGHVRKLLGDDMKQQAIGEMIRNPTALRGLQDRLELEHQGHTLWRDVQRKKGSRMDEELQDGLRGGLRSLSVRSTIGAAVDNIASRANLKFRNDVKERIAQVVTETNPQTVQEMMAAIAQRVQRDQDFAQSLHQSGVIATKAYGMNILPQTYGPEEE